MRSITNLFLCGLFLSFSFQTLSALPYDQFSAWECKVSRLKHAGKKLAFNDQEEAKRIEKKLEEFEKQDPDFLHLSKLDAKKPEFVEMATFHPPYDFNRLLSKKRPDIYLNASIIHTPEQEFILAGCPRYSSQVNELFMHLLQGKAAKRVWVSLLESTEGLTFCNNFWHPEFVKTLPLRDRWKLIHSSTEKLAQGKKSELIKTTLLFSKGHKKKTIYHLHYNGWVDRHTCPDRKLFIRLLQEMKALNKQKHTSSSKVPIVLNCFGGVGRSGMTLIGYCCYKKILACPSKKRSALVLNIPYMIYELRKQRPHAVENAEHLIALHKFLGTKFERHLQPSQKTVVSNDSGLGQSDSSQKQYQQ